MPRLEKRHKLRGRHSRESGNPFCSDASLKWIPAFAGMTAVWTTCEAAQNTCRIAVSESWNPVPLEICKSLDSSFRWNDGQEFPAIESLKFEAWIKD
jgi:hypothetical protein